MPAAPSFCIGSTANLLHGFKAVWHASDPGHWPFYPSPKQEFLPFPIDTTGEVSAWGPLQLDLCDSREVLFEKLFPYKVLADAGDASAISVGALLADDLRSTLALGQFFQETGIDLGKPDTKYALLKLSRISQTLNHPAIEKLGFSNALFYKNEVMSHALRRELVKLQSALNGGAFYQAADGKWQQGMDASGVQRFIDFFNQYGTHYVSKVITGDVIYQIFAYDAAVFASIKNLYQKHKDSFNSAAILSFRKFTTPVQVSSGKTTGYAAQIGHLCIKSQDDSFLERVTARHWMDTAIGSNSIFNCAAQAGRLQAFEHLVPVGFELSEILGFTRPALKMKGNRIFKALLFNKYGSKADILFPNLPLELPTQKNFNHQIIRHTKGNYYGFKDLLQAENLCFAEADTITKLCLSSPLFQLKSEHAIRLPGDEITIVAHAIIVEDKPVEILLSDRAFHSLQIHCEDFYGVLHIINESTGDAFTLADGFRYQMLSNSADPSVKEVQLCSEIKTAMAVREIDSPTSFWEHTLLMAESILDINRTPAPGGHRIWVSRYLNWLCGLPLKADAAFLTWQLQAHSLARVMAKIEWPAISREQGDLLQGFVDIIEQANRDRLKHCVAIQQQWFHIQQSDTDDGKRQTWLAAFRQQVKSMLEDYAALENARNLMREKLQECIQNMGSTAEMAERDLNQQLQQFREYLQQLENRLPAEAHSALLDEVFQQALTCLQSNHSRDFDKKHANKEAAAWFRNIQHLQNLMADLAALTKAGESQAGTAAILQGLGRNGIVWLRDKDWQSLTEYFRLLVQQEIKTDAFFSLEELLENAVEAFHHMIQSARHLMAIRARLFWYSHYRNSWSYYESRHQQQMDFLATDGAASVQSVDTLMEISHFHDQLYQRISSVYSLLKQSMA
ncbi:MAG TPA: MAC/perforin domain-containing protein [Saprospiraceae bacterium]|nr:MAC/perforin domain-containing protein [Saprospiraceae bacterium]HMQ84530.1 MAC/perforin domain-containing protein [Saprospiraceae bacterium]